jgi:hypothetical protein
MSNYIIKIIISNKIITYSFWLRESFEIPRLPVNFVENNQTINIFSHEYHSKIILTFS